ncbi:MAG TPA: sigma-70 family RNA polymerase sigma factor [Candidatus Binatia bacterium]|nr:sigma-70 family RNA polymerase sigma factor [Candidatus Binatia bacterium]
MSADISDAECVRRLQRGETEAFAILVERHQKNIFNLLYRMLGDYDDAAEVSQEAFLSAYRSIKSFRGDASFSTWLYRIAVNHANTRRKTVALLHHRAARIESLETTTDGASDPADALERKEMRERVQAALNGLDAEDATIILLRDLQDVPYEAVADILDVPIGTVKSRLHRARRALKARLAPYFKGKRIAK